jgi:hypothetical protein
MRYLKGILVGIAAAVVVFAMAIPGCFAVTGFMLARELGMAAIQSSGSGGIGAVSAGISIVPVFALALIAFLAGFLWFLRRDAKKRRALNLGP